jgi:hypothetical protein
MQELDAGVDQGERTPIPCSLLPTEVSSGFEMIGRKQES